MQDLLKEHWRGSWLVNAAIEFVFVMLILFGSRNADTLVSAADPAAQTTTDQSDGTAGLGGALPSPRTHDSKIDRINKGLQHFQKQEWLLAVEQFSEAINQFPDNPTGYWFRAQAKTKLGKVDSAKSDYGEVVRLVNAPSEVPVLRARGYALLELGRYDDATRDLNAALGLKPDDEESLMLRGRIHELAKKLESAAKDYSEVIRLSAKSADAFLRRGNVYMQLGRQQEGLADQKHAIRLGGITGGELIYHDSESGTMFRFVFIAPSTRWIGYDEQQRIAVAGAARQLLFGHNATPIQEIQLQQGFFILDREITLSQYEAFQKRRVGDDEPEKRGGEADLRLGTESSTVAETLASPRDPNGPITNVSWTEAMKFCETMQQRIGLAVRLPKEIEWECAARHERRWLYPWGDNTGEEFPAWVGRPSEGARPLNCAINKDVTPSGIHDMAGNVSEWCLDEYRNSLFDEPTKRHPYVPTAFSPDKDGESQDRATRGKRVKVLSHAPAGETDGSRRSFRGGSFKDDIFNCQVPVRRAMPATEASPAIGFRPVLLMRLEK